MINYQKHFNSALIDIIKNHSSGVQAYLCEVTKFDGIYVSALLKGDQNIKVELKEIPLVQSKYLQPIIMQGDLGLLINIHNEIKAILEGKNANFCPADTFVFLPLISKADKKRSSGEDFIISSAQNQSTIMLNDSELSLISGSPIEIKTVESLGSLISALFNILTALRTTPTAPGSPATLDPQIITDLISLKARFEEVVK